MARVGRYHGAMSARVDHLESDHREMRETQQSCKAKRQEREEQIHGRLTDVVKDVERIKGRMNGNGIA